MRKPGGYIFVCLGMFLFLSGVTASAEDLKRLSLDDVSSLGLKIQPDVDVKIEGAGSIKVTTEWPTVICLGEVTGLDVDNANLVYKATVKTDLAGDAFLEMWVSVGGGQYFSKGMNDVASGKSEWKMIQTPFILQKGQKAEKATLNLVINGKGTVWVDDVVLSKEPLK